MTEILASGTSNLTGTHDNGTCLFQWDGTAWVIIAHYNKEGFTCTGGIDQKIPGTSMPGWAVITAAKDE